jgi:hypothetical protein
MKASACLAMRDDGIPETAAHGMYLVYGWLRNELDKIQSFLRKEEPLK